MVKNKKEKVYTVKTTTFTRLVEIAQAFAMAGYKKKELKQEDRCELEFSNGHILSVVSNSEFVDYDCDFKMTNPTFLYMKPHKIPKYSKKFKCEYLKLNGWVCVDKTYNLWTNKEKDKNGTRPRFYLESPLCVNVAFEIQMLYDNQDNDDSFCDRFGKEIREAKALGLE